VLLLYAVDFQAELMESLLGARELIFHLPERHPGAVSTLLGFPTLVLQPLQ